MQNALITGTSTGIGEACAARLAERGWTVYAGVRRAEDGDRVKAQHAGDVRPVILDVTKADDISRVIAEITADVGDRGLQALVNNAGVGVGGPTEYLTDADWRWTFEVNLFAVVALTTAAIPLLRAGHGHVVHIGSIAGRVSSPGFGPYAASKHALEAFAESQRHEFARSGTPIKVSLIEPGEIATAIWDKAEAVNEEADRRLDDAGRRRYGWLIDQGRGFVEEGREKGIPASKVAEVVEQALTATKPKARYLVGQDAKLAGHVVTRMPDRARDAFTRFNSSLWEKRGRGLSGSRP